jgi:Nucleotidyl transferase AbiEii toxin, Type IV TA system
VASPVELAFRRAVADLDALRVRWALIGGLAISVRSAPRFTKDLDFAVAVTNDSEAQDVATGLLRFSSRSTWSASRVCGWSTAALT